MVFLIRLFSIVIVLTLLVGCGAEDRKQAYYDRGMELLAQGDATRARLEFKNVLQIDPKDAQAWYQVAEIEASDQNWNAAFGAYGKAIELDPGQLDARLKRGRLLFDSNQITSASSDVDAILAVEPNNAGALALRGAVRARQGDLAAAAQDAQAALAVDPGHRDGLLLLAEIRRAQNAPAETAELLARAVQAHPEDAQLRLSLAAIYQEQGDLAQAREQLEKLIELEPSQMLHVARLVVFFNTQGDKQAAEQVLREALQRNPELPQAKLLLVEWTIQERGTEDGARLLEQFITEEPDAYQFRFALGELRSSAGENDAAADIYRAIIERDRLGTEGLKARTLLAALDFAQQRTDAAQVLLGEVLKEDPRNVDALMLRGAIELAVDNPDAAIPALRDALQNSPGSIRALRLLAKAHEMRDELTLAQDALDKAIEAAPADPAAYLDLAQIKVRSGDMRGASAVLERFLDRAPDNTLVQSALARLQLGQQDWSAMEKTAERILAGRPDHPLGYYLKGLLQQRDGKLQESVEQFELAIAKRSDVVEPMLALARSYLLLEQPDAAETSLRRVLEQQPANAAALNLLGEIYAATQRYPEALAQFQQVISLYPKSPSAYARMADLHAQTGDLEKAIATLRSGIAETNRNAFLVFRLGVALQDSGQHAQAITTYEEVLKSNPDAEAVRNNLAMLLANHRQDDPASLARAVELTRTFADSDQWVLLDTLGWVQFRNGNLNSALGTLEKAAGLVDPVPAEMQYHLGMVYARLDRPAEAKANLSAALESNTVFPGREEARDTLEGL